VLWAQPVDAKDLYNRSTGALKPNVFLGRLFNGLATQLPGKEGRCFFVVSVPWETFLSKIA
jgi:hypothetical protein